MNWDNLTTEQGTVLSVSGKMENAIGYFRGLYFSAVSRDDKRSADIAFEMLQDAKIAHSQFKELLQKKS